MQPNPEVRADVLLEVLWRDPMILRCLLAEVRLMNSMFARKVSARCRLEGREDRDADDFVTECLSMAAKMSKEVLNVPVMRK